MIRQTHSSTRPNGGECSITFAGTAEEMENLNAMALGACWLRQTDAGLERIEHYKPVPSPIDDPMIPPKFDRPRVKFKCPPLGTATPADIDKAQQAANEAHRQYVKAPFNVREDIEPSEGWHFPSFIVRGVGAGGGGYGPAAQRLIDAGFECMRSRRGRDGHYWELWFLPSSTFARGTLKEAIGKLKSEQPKLWLDECRVVIDWLISNVDFGSAEVVVQRAALSYDD